MLGELGGGIGAGIIEPSGGRAAGMIVATAGHVDHGKTALVRALTGTDTDTLEEEKRRGLTINLGFAYFNAGPHRVGFIDVPGHQRFIKNMLAGVGAIDAVLLVVAADEGIMPQTREHLRIMDLVGLRRGVVVVTKVDRADATQLATLDTELAGFLAGTFLEHAPIIRTAATTGAGLSALNETLTALADELPERPAAGNFRLAIDRVFSVIGTGLVVTGTVYAGEVHVDEALAVCRNALPARVRGIYSEGQAAEVAAAGHRCALNLTGIRREQIKRGDWLTAPDAVYTATQVDIELRVPRDAAQPLRHWTPVHIFHGAAHHTGRVALLEAPLLKPGDTQLAQLVLDTPMAAVRGEPCVLRNQSADLTLAGGHIVDVFGSRAGRARASRIHWLRQMNLATPQASLAALLAEAKEGVPLAAFQIAWNLTEAEAETLYRELELVQIDSSDAGGRVRIGLAPAHWQALLDILVAAVKAWHQKHPDDTGIRLPALRAGVSAKLSQASVEAALNVLVGAHTLQQTGPCFHMPVFAARLPESETLLWDAVKLQLEAAGMHPPTLSELAARVDTDQDTLIALLRRLSDLGIIARVQKNRYFLIMTLKQLATRFASITQIAPAGLVAVADFRDQTGLGRNLSIAVLEYFDRVSLTRRVGNGRRLVKPVDTIFN